MSTPKSVAAYMAEIGAKGGAATGKSKKRGSKEFYRALGARGGKATAAGLDSGEIVRPARKRKSKAGA